MKVAFANTARIFERFNSLGLDSPYAPSEAGTSESTPSVPSKALFPRAFVKFSSPSVPLPSPLQNGRLMYCSDGVSYSAYFELMAGSHLSPRSCREGLHRSFGRRYLCTQEEFGSGYITQFSKERVGLVSINGYIEDDLLCYDLYLGDAGASLLTLPRRYDVFSLQSNVLEKAVNVVVGSLLPRQIRYESIFSNFTADMICT